MKYLPGMICFRHSTLDRYKHFPLELSEEDAYTYKAFGDAHPTRSTEDLWLSCLRSSDWIHNGHLPPKVAHDPQRDSGIKARNVERSCEYVGFDMRR